MGAVLFNGNVEKRGTAYLSELLPQRVNSLDNRQNCSLPRWTTRRLDLGPCMRAADCIAHIPIFIAGARVAMQKPGINFPQDSDLNKVYILEKLGIQDYSQLLQSTESFKSRPLDDLLISARMHCLSKVIITST